ncbi:putative ATPase [Prosthecobacter fusiformis]|uniref:Putative ATPase n=1 Tax=Prosthecobacter fusiformis TaxID=48464 RepID=A0A4V3FG04_9BACT|nr:AAA family ATPase [Prosthecobacter fusiformis]TDU72773.1 putative ATPase [Prosthecobacter fusiformis]
MLKPAPSQYLHTVRLERGEVPGFSEYPFNIPAVRHLDSLPLHPKVTFFVGENGSGKSTLLEAIAEKLGFSMEGGTKNTNMAMHEYRCALTSKITLSRTHLRPMDGFFLRAESYYNFATLIDELGTWSYGGKSLHEQSHGESFFATMIHRMGGHGIYLFDEPEAALSPQRQMSLLVRMHDLIDDFSQFIIATHSPILMAYPDAWIYQFSEDGIQRIAYEDTDHFQITSRFMRDPKGMIHRLLGTQEDRHAGGAETGGLR